MPNESAEKPEWWLEYFTNRLEDEYDNFVISKDDARRVMTESTRLERNRIKEIVEDTCNENGVLCTRDKLLARIDQDKLKS